MKKKLTSVLVLVLVFSMLLVACNTSDTDTQETSTLKESEGAEAKIGKGRTLVVGIWSDSQEEIIRELIVPKFEEQTGAKVELVLGSSPDRYARIYAELDNPTFDVVYLNQAHTEQASKDGVILPANPDNVPEYKNLYEIAKNSGGYGISLTCVGLMYSTETFSEPPTSWKVCWDAAYAGRVAPYAFPSTQGTGFLIMAAKLNGGNENNIDPGFEALKKLKPYPQIITGVDDANIAFKNGDVVLAPQLSSVVYTYKMDGGPVDFVIPEEGAVLAMNCAGITKNSKNVDLAEIWINMQLSPEVQKAYAERIYFGPTNSTVVLSDEVAEMVIYGEEEVARLYCQDNSVVTANQAAWTERWNKEIVE
jgi:putative spermidine/putrescine transport system substrate-binding protein